MSSIVKALNLRQMSKALRRLSRSTHRPYPKHFLLYNNTHIHQCRYFASQDIHVPNLGDSITEGTIVSIFKKVGEEVAADEVVLEIETDKVTVDIRAPSAGYIESFYEDVESDVEVGAPLYSLSDEPIDPSKIPEKTEKPAKKIETNDNTQTSQSSQPPPLTPTSTTTTTSTQTQSSSAHRIPAIRFKYGDRAAIDAIIFGSSSPLTAQSIGSDTEAGGQMQSLTFEFFDLPPGLQRATWTDAEIDAVNLGGAGQVWSR